MQKGERRWKEEYLFKLYRANVIDAIRISSEEEAYVGCQVLGV